MEKKSQKKSEIKKENSSNTFFIKALHWLENYFTKVFLPPWIWIWGIFSVVSIFLWFYQISPKNQLIQLKVGQNSLPNIELDRYWQQIFVFILINYTLNIVLQSRYPRLQILFLSASFIILMFLILLSFPYLWETFRLA